MEIKAIETIYKNYKFRSRLEARWAVFFDVMEIKYEYEKEGYDLGDAGRYLPDFWLPGMDMFIEVKGQEPTAEEIKKCQELSLQSGKIVGMVFSDFCSFDVYERHGEVKTKGSNLIFFPDRPDENDYFTGSSFKACEVCAHIFYHWVIGDCCPKCADLVGDTYNAKRKLETAYIKAKQARFEHGEDSVGSD